MQTPLALQGAVTSLMQLEMHIAFQKKKKRGPGVG